MKLAVARIGEGNIFIDDIRDKKKLENSIKNLCSINKNGPFKCFFKYFFAEEQKTFPRISRKTGEKKPGYLSYRMVGIANKEGHIGHFIATKSISASIDSHQREKMKCYFFKPGKTHHEQNEWLFEAYGPKDKYHGEGENFIDINPNLIQKISKRMYQLYADIKTMSNEAFKEHISHLIVCKNNLNSREEKIARFTMENREEQDLTNKMDLTAFKRTSGIYNPLAADIAVKMVSDNTVNLGDFGTNYHDLTFFFYTMYKIKQFKALNTATKDQLNYYLNDYQGVKCDEMIQIAKQILSAQASLETNQANSCYLSA